MTAAAVWALVALCAVFWGLRLGAARALPAGAASVERLPEPADPQAVARLLGGQVATGAGPAESSRLVLLGVAAGVSGAGAALIAVDGDAARPFRVGSQVQAGLWLQSLQGRQARLGPAPQGATTLTLELPPQDDVLAPPGR